jgi:hypothetical protein
VLTDLRRCVPLLVIAAVTSARAQELPRGAGFADSQPRASVSFPIFATAGSDDFNYIEMRQLDRKLTSPHSLAVFVGLALVRIRGQLSRWASDANAEAESSKRSQARRVLRAVTSGTGQVQDADYRRLLEQYGLKGR